MNQQNLPCSPIVHHLPPTHTPTPPQSFIVLYKCVAFLQKMSSTKILTFRNCLGYKTKKNMGFQHIHSNPILINITPFNKQIHWRIEGGPWPAPLKLVKV